MSILYLYHQNVLLKINFGNRLKIPFKVNIYEQAEEKNYHLKFNTTIVSDTIDGDHNVNELQSNSKFK